MLPEYARHSDEKRLYMNTLLTIFLIAGLGYLVGSVRFKGLHLGTSGVLLVALIFGHFSAEIPGIVCDIGLVCFVTAVGFIAGPTFFHNLRSHAAQYAFLGLLVTLCGAAICVVSIMAFGLPVPLVSGILMGALTSTPGLAAAIEASADGLPSIGYGIAYPFGAMGVVLFVQLTPRILGIDPVLEGRKKSSLAAMSAPAETAEKYFSIDPMGFFPFCAAIAVGVLLAVVRVPLPGGASFSLGNTGGPLFAGLLFGHFRHVGKISFTVPNMMLKVMRELGLVFFLLGAGVSAGKGFVGILAEYGVTLFIHGVLMTLIPMLLGFFVAYYVMKLDLLDSLGSICGGMTSTPALGALASAAETDCVASPYAATYPIALICAILIPQFLVLFL